SPWQSFRWSYRRRRDPGPGHEKSPAQARGSGRTIFGSCVTARRPTLLEDLDEQSELSHSPAPASADERDFGPPPPLAHACTGSRRPAVLGSTRIRDVVAPTKSASS